MPKPSLEKHRYSIESETQDAAVRRGVRRAADQRLKHSFCEAIRQQEFRAVQALDCDGEVAGCLLGSAAPD
jgi:uncharacterized protein (UPF0147 family)